MKTAFGQYTVKAPLQQLLNLNERGFHAQYTFRLFYFFKYKNNAALFFPPNLLTDVKFFEYDLCIKSMSITPFIMDSGIQCIEPIYLKS